MSSDKKRVQFRAPRRLIDRTDALADVLGEDRTDILVTALREYLQEAAHGDALTQKIAAGYYDDEISFEQLKELVGAEEATNLRVLKQQLNEDFVDEVADVSMSQLVADTSALVSLGIVADYEADPLAAYFDTYEEIVPAAVVEELEEVAPTRMYTVGRRPPCSTDVTRPRFGGSTSTPNSRWMTEKTPQSHWQTNWTRHYCCVTSSISSVWSTRRLPIPGL